MKCSANVEITVFKKKNSMESKTGFVSERLREILFTRVLQHAPLIFITTGLFMGPYYASKANKKRISISLA